MSAWKDIKGYEGYYQISKHGHVKSLNHRVSCSDGRVMTIKERILSLCPTSTGQYGTILNKDNSQKWFCPKYELGKYFK